MFIVLLSSIVNVSDKAKCVSLNNQKYEIQTTIISLHPNEYSEEFHYYPFVIKLDRCVRSCNTLNDLSNKVCVPNKTEDLNLSVFNMITGKNESKALKKHRSCECRFKLDGIKCNSNQWWNNYKCWCECKKHDACKRYYTWNPATCTWENRKYLASIMDDSTITCDKVIESYEEEINLNEKKIICKTQNFYILLAFWLITVALLIVVSIYCYLIKYIEENKNKLKKLYIENTNKKWERKPKIYT